MGMNQRNISYISCYNRRELFPIVDDKLKTKTLALDHGLKVPHLIGVVANQYDVRRIDRIIGNKTGFCIKPAKGSGGKGILVISNVEDGVYFRSNGEAILLSDIQRHTSNILAGLFSLGGVTDVAVIEGLIESDPLLAKYSHEGVPDIRVIVFRGIPIMAMMRLSCRASNGKANLHQGAIGVGLDIATGKAVNAVQNDKPITVHPDNQQQLMSLSLPDWDKLLYLACECYDMTGLGYLGVDLVIDANQGPTLLELNARPGLSIQIANNQGLLPRLSCVEEIKYPGRMTVRQRVDFAKQNFSRDSDEKQVIMNAF